jgi:hypothetical protein
MPRQLLCNTSPPEGTGLLSAPTVPYGHEQAGQVSVTVSSAGTYHLVAAYPGSSDFTGSASAPKTLVVK